MRTMIGAFLMLVCVTGGYPSFAAGRGCGVYAFADKEAPEGIASYLKQGNNGSMIRICAGSSTRETQYFVRLPCRRI
ncbi:MAG TPA: hypothetical protein VJX67_09125 [Blastocatellia bacterium]|nr:hypothetical protein [Blastocatellia bacterium]